MLPKELINKAVTLAKEPTWTDINAKKVIQWLKEHNYAVVGVELWKELDGSPEWIATSNYACNENTSWIEYIVCCANGASQFVQRFSIEPGALFNLTWIDENEIK